MLEGRVKVFGIWFDLYWIFVGGFFLAFYWTVEVVWFQWKREESREMGENRYGFGIYYFIG